MRYILTPDPHAFLPQRMKKKQSVIGAFKSGAIGEEKEVNQEFEK